MAFVSDLKFEDNSAPASPTSQITAQRLGKALRDRYQNHIHKKECEPGQTDYDVKMASRALAAFSLFHLGGVDDPEAGEGVCDSSKDGGIDGICVNHNEKLVVVVQSKFNQSGGGTWTRDDFLAFKDACEKLQEEHYQLFDTILQNKQSDISLALSSFDYKFIFVMTHTGKKGTAEQILKDMQAWQEELNSAALMDENTPNEDLAFQVHLVSAEDLQQWLHAGTRKTIDIEDVEIERYGYIDEPFKAFYGVISGDQIADWWKSHGTRLFSKNIRNILGKTEVNEAIKTTAMTKPDLFWYFNNGITLLVRDVEPHRRNSAKGSERGTFGFRDVSVINGAQTVSSIGMISDSLGDSISNIKISARFIKISDNGSDSIANDITKANNFQNRVLGRDFASQRPEQHRLARELVIENYHYQLLRSDAESTQIDKKTIDLDEALNALACMTANSAIVATLKSNRGRFFDNFEGTLYNSVFNPTTPGIKLINAVLHLRVIDNLISKELGEIDKTTHGRRHLIITHANRYLASVLLNSVKGIRKSIERIEPDETALKFELDILMTKTEDFIEKKYPNAYPARFFANSSKLDELYNSLEKPVC